MSSHRQNHRAPERPARREHPQLSTGRAILALATALWWMAEHLVPIGVRGARATAHSAYAYRGELAPFALATIAAWVSRRITSGLPTPWSLVATIIAGATVLVLVARHNWTHEARSSYASRRTTTRLVAGVHASWSYVNDDTARWEGAAVDAMLCDRNGTPASIEHVTALTYGVELIVSIPSGRTLGHLQSHADGLTSAFRSLGVRRVIIPGTGAQTGTARIILLTNEHLLTTPVSTWGDLTADELALVWADVATTAGLSGTTGGLARLCHVTTQPYGTELVITIPAGQTAAFVATQAERLVPRLNVARAIVMTDLSTPDRAHIAVVPLALAHLLATPVGDWADLDPAVVALVWGEAARPCELTSVDGTATHVVAVERHTHAITLTVTIGAGREYSHVAANASKLGPLLGIYRAVAHTTPVPGQALINLILENVLAEPLGPWPSLADPLPHIATLHPLVAMDELGRPVHLSMVEQHLLTGGVTGSGKSVGLQVVLASHVLAVRADGTAAVQLEIIDPKAAEFSRYAGIAHTMVTTSINETLDLLGGLVAEMDRRMAHLTRVGRRKWDPAIDGEDHDMPLIILVCDELADLTRTTDRRVKDLIEALRLVLSKGRAAGICVLGATQRPTAAVIPTPLRDQFTLRWAYRCADVGGREAILGELGTNCDVVGIPNDTTGKGVGFLATETGGVARVRSYFLSDTDLDTIVTRALAIPGRVTGTSHPTPAPTPEASVPEPSAPKTSVPEVSTPDVSTPDVSTPNVSTKSLATDVPVVVVGLNLARARYTERFRKQYSRSRGVITDGPVKLSKGDIEAELTPLCALVVGTVAPIAGTLAGRLVRCYEVGPMTLIVEAKNRELLGWVLGAPELDTIPVDTTTPI